MAQATAQLAGISLSKEGGRTIYVVRGLDGNTEAVAAQALEAAGLPQKNDPHPAIGGLKVLVAPTLIEMLGNSDARVEVVWGIDENQGGGGAPGAPNLGSFSLDGRLMIERTQRDASNAIIQLRSDPAQDGLGGGGSLPSATERPPQTGETEKQVMIMTLKVQRNSLMLPLNMMTRHVGTLNDATFFNFPAEFWLSAAVAASSSDGGINYAESFEFWGRPDGWLRGVTYVLDGGGFPKVTPELQTNPNPPHLRLADQPAATNIGPPDQRLFNGLTLVRVQRLSDFSRFNITTPSNLDAP